MQIKRIIVSWLLKISRIPSIIKALRNYGPDGTRVISRDMSSADVYDEVFRNWSQELTFLLPRRYQQILARLHEEDLISVEEFDTHYRLAQVAVLGSFPDRQIFADDGCQVKEVEFPFPWIRDQNLLQQASPLLQKRIQEFEKDLQIVHESEVGALQALKFNLGGHLRGGKK